MLLMMLLLTCDPAEKTTKIVAKIAYVLSNAVMRLGCGFFCIFRCDNLMQLFFFRKKCNFNVINTFSVAACEYFSSIVTVLVEYSSQSCVQVQKCQQFLVG